MAAPVVTKGDFVIIPPKGRAAIATLEEAFERGTLVQRGESTL